jgi:hypothetical protein
MKKYILLSTLFASSLFASTNMTCEVTYNYDSIFTRTLSLPVGAKNFSFGLFEEFEFFLTDLGNDKLELQILDNTGPARNYATGKLTSETSLELAIWRRDYLIDVRCHKN